MKNRIKQYDLVNSDNRLLFESGLDYGSDIYSIRQMLWATYYVAFSQKEIAYYEVIYNV